MVNPLYMYFQQLEAFQRELKETWGKITILLIQIRQWCYAEEILVFLHKIKTMLLWIEGRISYV